MALTLAILPVNPNGTQMVYIQVRLSFQWLPKKNMEHGSIKAHKKYHRENFFLTPHPWQIWIEIIRSDPGCR